MDLVSSAPQTAPTSPVLMTSTFLQVKFVASIFKLVIKLKAKSVHLRAGDGLGTDRADAFDGVWSTPALPDTDYCAGLKEQLPATGK